MKKNNSEKKKRSKAPIVAVVTAAIISAAVSASQYVEVFKADGDMSQQEADIATTLEKINLETTGDDRKVVIDCGISAIEGKFISKDAGGWALKVPGFDSNVLHLRSKFCDGFSSKDPDTVAKILFALSDTMYGRSANDPCAMKIADELSSDTLERVYRDNQEKGEDFIKIMAGYVTGENDCNMSIEELTVED